MKLAAQIGCRNCAAAIRICCGSRYRSDQSRYITKRHYCVCEGGDLVPTLHIRFSGADTMDAARVAEVIIEAKLKSAFAFRKLNSTG